LGAVEALVRKSPYATPRGFAVEPSREAVDAMTKAASANGGTADIDSVQDLGFMYNCNLADPDGHVWVAMWINPAAIPSGK